jgi:hypothetical protein
MQEMDATNYQPHRCSKLKSTPSPLPGQQVTEKEIYSHLERNAESANHGSTEQAIEQPKPLAYIIVSGLLVLSTLFLAYPLIDVIHPALPAIRSFLSEVHTVDIHPAVLVIAALLQVVTFTIGSFILAIALNRQSKPRPRTAREIQYESWGDHCEPENV